MTDSVASRVSRIITGGAHALLDKAENLAPESAMAQSIREVEQVIDEVRGELGKAEAAKHLAQAQIARLEGEHVRLAEQSAFAVSQGRDDLAEAAIGRQSDIEDLLPALRGALDEQSARASQQERFILALLAKKRELEQALRAYLAAQAAAPLAGEGLPGDPAQVRLGRVEAAASSFDRVLARQTGLSGLGDTATKDAARLGELAEMQRSHRIAERLAAIKAARAGA